MSTQLVSYIAPSAPATRRPATGNEPFIRPEIGFTPAWYRQHLEIDFGQRWHTDVYAPCDLVIADIEAGTPDQRVRFALDICSQLSACKVAGASSSGKWK